ncbi:MAG: sigma-70 family RNA polymerase sigma factor [Planctomycetota bacterium]
MPTTPAGPTTSATADALDQEGREAFLRARQGDRQAFATVVRIYYDRLFNAVYRLVSNHDDAADLTQETFAKAFEKVQDHRGESGPYAWLFRIAVNASMTHIRRGRRRRTIVKEAAADPTLSGMTGDGTGWRTGFASDPAEATEQSEDHRAVVAAMNRLDAETRALLVMRDLEGFDYDQMSQILEVPLGTLKSKLFRARVALRELLQDHFETRRLRGQA